MRVRLFAAAVLMGVGGCATCQTCRAIEPSAQTDAAPPPPRVPRFVAPEEDEPEQELPPLPVPRPGTGRVTKTTETTTRREVEGQSIVVEQHAAGVIVIGSSGMAVPTVAGRPAAFTAPPVEPGATYPIIPGPVPDSLIVAAARRVAKATYVLVTGECPPPRAPKLYAAVPTTAYQMVPVTMAPAPAQAPAVVYQAAPALAPAPAVVASPQAPRKHWFSR